MAISDYVKTFTGKFLIKHSLINLENYLEKELKIPKKDFRINLDNNQTYRTGYLYIAHRGNSISEGDIRGKVANFYRGKGFRVVDSGSNYFDIFKMDAERYRIKVLKDEIEYCVDVM
ncbi:MAG: hypothetical protein KKE23_02510 [Nanoarchaeota archaeon]|nr:hypothetical protein [Nanoarchaeota archaeon]